jgi:hypothetical protein
MSAQQIGREFNPNDWSYNAEDREWRSRKIQSMRFVLEAGETNSTQTLKDKFTEWSLVN